MLMMSPSLYIAWSRWNPLAWRVEQQTWLKSFIELPQLFLFRLERPPAGSLSLSARQNEKKDDTTSKLIMIGQLFQRGLSKINNYFLDSVWQPLMVEAPVLPRNILNISQFGKLLRYQTVLTGSRETATLINVLWQQLGGMVLWRFILKISTDEDLNLWVWKLEHGHFPFWGHLCWN